MDMSSQLHATVVLFPRKELSAPLDRRLDGHQGQFGPDREERTMSISEFNLNSSIIQPVSQPQY
jgi:hypothetical protein